MQLHIDQKGQFRSPRSPQDQATTGYLWHLSANRLLVHLTYGRNHDSQRCLRGDLEYLRCWLHEPDLGAALARLFGNGHDAAVALVLDHRDHMVATGKAVGTINRHLCTLRAAARIAREMGHIDWDLADVPGIGIYDNGQAGNVVPGVEGVTDGNGITGMAAPAAPGIA
jgi:hypothetical protein